MVSPVGPGHPGMTGAFSGILGSPMHWTGQGQRRSAEGTPPIVGIGDSAHRMLGGGSCVQHGRKKRTGTGPTLGVARK